MKREKKGNSVGCARIWFVKFIVSDYDLCEKTIYVPQKTNNFSLKMGNLCLDSLLQDGKKGKLY